MGRVLHDDDFSCPWCGHLMDAEFAEANIGKSLWCEGCNYPVVVVLTKSTFLTLNRRMRAMRLINRKETFKKELPVMMSIAKKYIKEEHGKVTQELTDEFFKNARKVWVMRARRKVVFELHVLGYMKQQIVSFFKENGGGLKRNTLYLYLHLESIE
jgi:hypothetical protein